MADPTRVRPPRVTAEAPFAAAVAAGNLEEVGAGTVPDAGVVFEFEVEAVFPFPGSVATPMTDCETGSLALIIKITRV